MSLEIGGQGNVAGGNSFALGQKLDGGFERVDRPKKVNGVELNPVLLKGLFNVGSRDVVTYYARPYRQDGTGAPDGVQVVAVNGDHWRNDLTTRKGVSGNKVFMSAVFSMDSQRRGGNFVHIRVNNAWKTSIPGGFNQITDSNHIKALNSNYQLNDDEKARVVYFKRPNCPPGSEKDGYQVVAIADKAIEELNPGTLFLEGLTKAFDSAAFQPYEGIFPTRLIGCMWTHLKWGGVLKQSPAAGGGPGAPIEYIENHTVLVEC